MDWRWYLRPKARNRVVVEDQKGSATPHGPHGPSYSRGSRIPKNANKDGIKTGVGGVLYAREILPKREIGCKLTHSVQLWTRAVASRAQSGPVHICALLDKARPQNRSGPDRWHTAVHVGQVWTSGTGALHTGHFWTSTRRSIIDVGAKESTSGRFGRMARRDRGAARGNARYGAQRALLYNLLLGLLP